MALLWDKFETAASISEMETSLGCLKTLVPSPALRIYEADLNYLYYMIQKLKKSKNLLKR